MASIRKIKVDDLISALNEKIDGILGSLVSQGGKCALVDFPNYSNVGDSAIWLGETKWLSMNRNQLIYVCDQYLYSRETLAEQLGDGCILLQGGGNLGDLWPDHQRFRERVIQDFPNNKIIQLPQSIHFRQSKNLERARQIFNRHPDLTLLLRDERSLELARREFTATSILCPDMAFSLAAIDRPCQPSVDILWLSRTDKESSGPRKLAIPFGVERVDWLEEAPTVLREQCQSLTNRLRIHPQEWPSLGPKLTLTYDLLAEERLLRGCRILSQGKIVVSNRLHAHILSLLMGIPHILLDNIYGKVKNFYDAWTKDCEIVRWANSSEKSDKNALYDTQFRATLNNVGADVSSLEKFIASLAATSDSCRRGITEDASAKSAASAQREQIEMEITALIPMSQRFIFVDDDQIRSELYLGDRVAVPFLERDGKYWGPPPDNNTAIRELERLREAGATHITFAHPAYWWLDYYSSLNNYLNSHFRRVLNNEYVIAYDLRRDSVGDLMEVGIG